MAEPIRPEVREITAKEAALRVYANAHDKFSELEVIDLQMGQEAEAEGAHAFALIALRAYRAELDDPEPAA